MLGLEAWIAYVLLAIMQGLLVFLPRADVTTWRRLSPSPRWAVVLPGSLLIGTFGVLAVPASATGLAVLAAFSTPILAVVAVLAVARGRRSVWFATLAALPVGMLALGEWGSSLATTALAALGTLALGALLVRATPLAWLGGGIAAMAVVDVALLATGVGQPAAELLQTALDDSPLPEFHRAELGPITKDYPDMVLAAVLGSALAGTPLQRPAAALVAVLAAANGLLFLFADMLPATLPLAVAAAIIAVMHRAGYGAGRPLPRVGAIRAQGSSPIGFSRHSHPRGTLLSLPTLTGRWRLHDAPRPHTPRPAPPRPARRRALAR